MTLKNFCLIGTIGILLFATSCKKSETPPDTINPPSNAAFPYLQDGALWSYINSDTDPNHAGNTFETSYTITGIDAHGYVYVDWQIPSLLQKVTWYVDTAQWANPADKITGDKFTLITAKPLPGDTFSITYTTGTKITYIRRVMSLGATKTVPAGTFKSCALIHETTTADSKYYEDYWIHPIYGIIRMEGTTKDDYPVIKIQELKELPF
jgi:hypothetical protein